MSIITKLKAESLQQRKAKGVLAPFLSFVLSEVANVGKNDGGRLTSDDEAVKVMLKVIANNDKAVAVLNDSSKIEVLTAETNLLKGMLPTMATKDQITALLHDTFGAEKPKNKGEAITYIREEFGSAVDLREAAEIVTEMYFQ